MWKESYEEKVKKKEEANHHKAMIEIIFCGGEEQVQAPGPSWFRSITVGFYRAGLARPRANPTSSLVQTTPRRAIPLKHCCNMFTLPSQPFRCLVPQVENSLNSQSTVPFPLLALQYHRAEPVNLTLKEKSCA